MQKRATVWLPTFEDVEGAAANLSRRNLWRVAPLYDFDDLMQEARIRFLRLQVRYPRVVEAPQFMALFYRSFSNLLHTLAARRGRSASGHCVQPGALESEDGSNAGLDGFPGSADPSREERFAAKLDRAPPEIQALVQGVNEAPRKPRLKRSKGTRETTNTFLCRLAKLDPATVDLRTALDSFIDSPT